MSATEQHGNKIFCFAIKIIKMIKMLEEAYGKMEMKKTQVYY
jgi:hypothetical protein